ncbi:MAG: helix-turn-helix domain-containing protein [Planctomycetales bacterium]|nr:helix-turn-helix domain-containing protein [Planctomycetales bacterium]
MNRTDRHNEIELNFVLTESVTFQIGGRRVLVPPGMLNVFWAAVPHQLAPPVSKDAYYVTTIPLNTFLRFELPEAMVQAVLGGQILNAEIEAVLPAAETRLDAWISDINSAHPLRSQATILELQSLLLRIWSDAEMRVEHAATHSKRTLNQADVSAVERIAAYVALHYTEPLTIAQISDATGLASGYAMTLFRKVFGQTMMENVLDHRLAHAQRLLISTEQQILDIAFESGFGSLSRFNAVFKQHCKCSPRQYRKLHRDESLPLKK